MMDLFRFTIMCIMFVLIGYTLGDAQKDRDNQTQEIIAACAAGVEK